MAAHKLSPKHRMFVREYVKDRNATRSYVAAGYSRKGAAQSAALLLRNPYVAAAVEAGLRRLEEKCEISAERTLKRIAEIAYQKLEKSDLKMRSATTLKACELLGKHFKMFTDVQEVTGRDGGPQVVLHLPANGSEAVKTEDETVNTSIDAPSDNEQT